MNIIQLYEDYVRKNKSTIHSAEMAARTMLQLLPGRFADSELTTECAYSVVNLVSFYHQLIQTPAPTGSPPRSTLNSAARGVYNWITSIRQVELLIEVAAKRFLGKHRRWGVVYAVELIKTILRLFELRRVIQQGACVLIEDVQLTAPNTPAPPAAPVLSGAGLPIAPAPVAPPPTPLPMGTVLPSTAVMTRTRVWAEVLHIIRPIVYLSCVLAMGRRRWLPWLASLAVDAASLFGQMPATVLVKHEQDELVRRVCLLFFYLLRSPAFDRVLLNPLTRVLKALSYLPVVGGLVGNAQDLVLLLQDHYFYTAKS